MIKLVIPDVEHSSSSYDVRSEEIVQYVGDDKKEVSK